MAFANFIVLVLLKVVVRSYSRRVYNSRMSQMECIDLASAIFEPVASGNNGQLLKMSGSTGAGNPTALKISSKDLSFEFKVQKELASIDSQPFFKSPGEAFSCQCKDVPMKVKNEAKWIAGNYSKRVPSYSDTDMCYFLNQQLLGKDLKVDPPSRGAAKRSIVFQISFAYYWAKRKIGFSHSDSQFDNYVLTMADVGTARKFCFSVQNEIVKRIWCIPAKDTEGRLINIIDFGKSGTKLHPRRRDRVGMASPAIEEKALRFMVNAFSGELSDAISKDNGWLDTLTSDAFESYVQQENKVPEDGVCYGDCEPARLSSLLVAGLGLN